MNQRNNSHHRNRLDVPPRRRADSTTPNPHTEKTEAEPHYSKSELAKMRQNYGFDNIPVEDEDLDNVRLRDIIRAWIAQATGRKEKPSDQKNSRMRAIKNDIKWALQADLDEPVKPYIKPPAQPSTTQKNAGKTVTPNSQQPPAKPDSGTSIDININFGALPSLASIKKYLQKIISFIAQRKRTAAGVIVVVIIAGVGLNVLSGFIDESNLKKENISSTKPEFDTLLPNGKSITGLGGWKRVSPPGTAPAFAYSDKIGDVTIAVSQQALPDDFKKDTGNQMTELAKNFNATEKLTTANGTHVYIGSSAQGPQSAILAIDHLLILIKSTGKIEDKKWASYVDSLISPVQKF